MKIKLDASRRDTPAWYGFIFAINQLEKASGKDLPRSKDGVYDVKLLIEGREVPFDKFMERYNNGTDEFVAKKAVELMDEQFGGLVDTVESLKAEVLRLMRDKYGLNSEEGY